MTDAKSRTGRSHANRHRFRDCARTVTDHSTAKASSFKAKIHVNSILNNAHGMEVQFNRPADGRELSFLREQSE